MQSPLIQRNTPESHEFPCQYDLPKTYTTISIEISHHVSSVPRDLHEIRFMLHQLHLKLHPLKICQCWLHNIKSDQNQVRHLWKQYMQINVHTLCSHFTYFTQKIHYIILICRCKVKVCLSSTKGKQGVPEYIFCWQTK